MPWCSNKFSFSISIFVLLLCTTVFKNTSASKHLANALVLQIVTESKSELQRQRLRQKLAADDKVAVDVPADGNCLFASLAHQLQRSDVPNVRSEIVQYIAQHREEFNEACRLDIACEESNSFRYLHRMSADRTWGDGIILSAAARLYGTPIHLITTDGNRHVEINLPGTHSGDDSLQLGYIAHSGVDKNHFVSIVHKAREVADDSKTDNTLQFKTKAAGSLHVVLLLAHLVALAVSRLLLQQWQTALQTLPILTSAVYQSKFAVAERLLFSDTGLTISSLGFTSCRMYQVYCAVYALRHTNSALIRHALWTVVVRMFSWRLASKTGNEHWKNLRYTRRARVTGLQAFNLRITNVLALTADCQTNMQNSNSWHVPRWWKSSAAADFLVAKD